MMMPVIGYGSETHDIDLLAENTFTSGDLMFCVANGG
jgi:hypothetical protein